MRQLNYIITFVAALLVWQAGSLPAAWSLKQARLMTPWAETVNPAAVLPEYPRPQMARANWLNLNGLWQYKAGLAGDAVPAGQALSGEILVPFAVESAISGVMEHHDRLWYRRLVTIPAGWSGQRVLLHFGAVDWESEVYINGTSLGIHRGGYDSFTYDITANLAGSGQQELIVRVFDPTNTQNISCGKQVLAPGGIWYTPVSGIWQTVWLEAAPAIAIEDLKLTPDIDQNCLKITAPVSQPAAGLTIQAIAYDNGLAVGTVSGAPGEALNLMLRSPKLWSPENPFLYDLMVLLKQNGQVIDQVDSYFGMRKIEIKSMHGINRMVLNNQFRFEIGPLDQGWWPDGLYTAPTDAALKWDLDMIKAFGYNMVRKHVKVEPARWYYWADKLGLLVWQDMPSMPGGSSPGTADRAQYELELEQMIREHWNHPSIILWVVFNEGWGQYDTVRVTEKAMALDPSRLVSCASGWTDYPVGHILDHHAYPAPGNPTPTATRASVCGEYGGIGMQVAGHMWDEDSWGYTMVNTGAELAALYDAFIQQLQGYQSQPGLSAGVYTQITDVEVEINGLITYDRKVVKADVEQIRLSNAMYQRSWNNVTPTSQAVAQTWRYTTATPANGWQTVGFNDGPWSAGPGGFGTSFTPGTAVRTTWNSADIWLRREFAAGSLTPEEVDKLVMNIHHDEEAEVYLNGQLAATLTGYTTNYIRLPISTAARNAFKPNDTNLLAVHCHQTVGGQYIDVGLGWELVVIPDFCGQWGYAPADLNQDCRVDLSDLAMMATGWLEDYRLQQTVVSGLYGN